MARRAAAAVVFAVGSGMACGWARSEPGAARASGALPAARTDPYATLTLASLDLVLEVDGHPAVSADADGVVHLRFGERATREIAIGPQVAAAYPERVELGPQSVLTYTIERVEGGSGGAEEHLDGTLVSGEGRWDVSCTDQRESEPPDARWCFPILASARPFHP